MRPTRAFLYTSVAVVGTALFAADTKFSGIDRNRDRMVTRDEWHGSSRAFENLDTNNDGAISGSELPRGWRDAEDSDLRQYRIFSRMDHNKNDMIERSEWRGSRPVFQRFDTDADGSLSWNEYSAGIEEGMRSRAAGPAGKLDDDSSGAVEGNEWPYNRALFHQLDTDANSVLTEDELEKMTQATMNQLDKNKDGRIDNDEWPGGFAKFRDLDADNDGVVSAAEYFKRGGDWQRRQRFQAWDKNDDGIIQSTEWKSDAALFHRLDTDRDSRVSLSEFMGEVQTRARTQERASRLDTNASGAVEGNEWPYNRELFHQLDTDTDSVLSDAELNNVTQATMNQLDKNNNGAIERDEWPGDFATFRDLDRNNDSRVNASEYFERGTESQRRHRFQAWDKNNDGIVQSTEWQSEPNLFHRLDTNRNSQLEWEEFSR